MGWRSRASGWVAVTLMALVSAVRALPDTYILLPVSSFTSNTSLVADYSCSPTYTSTPCSGHGTCYLLLDSADAISLPYLNTSTAAPVIVASSSLDTYGIDVDTPLPAAVCVCGSGWTGRGDYINHFALDGDSCGNSKAAITALNIVAVVLFVPLLLLAIHRLYLWSVWHSATLHETVIAAPSQHDDVSGNAPVQQQSRSTNVPHSNQRIAPHSVVSPNNAATSRQPHPLLSATTASSGPTKPSAAALVDHREAQHRGINNSSSDRHRRALLKAHLSHITFLYPFCSLLFAVSSLLFFALRLFTDYTVGCDYGMSVLVYLNHVPFICCTTFGVANTLQVCGAIIGRQRQHLLSLITATRRYLGLLTVVTLFSYMVVFFVRYYHGREQLMAHLMLLLCWAPDFVILGPLSVGSFIRLLPALIADVDKLSVDQQAARYAVYNKLRSFCYLIGFLVTGNTIAILILSISPTLRQTGLPIYVYFWYYSAYGFIIVRLMLLQPPKSANNPQPTAAVSPMAAARTGSAGMKEKASGGRPSVESVELHTAAASLNGSRDESVDAGLGGWTERSKHPPGMVTRAVMNSVRIDEGVEDSSRRATPLPVPPRALFGRVLS